MLITFCEFITSTTDASVSAVLTQLLRLYAAYNITCQAADFIEVSVTDPSLALQFCVLVKFSFCFSGVNQFNCAVGLACCGISFVMLSRH